MRILTTRGRLLASSVLCGALAFGAATSASAQAAASGASQSTGEIVVTGTRIRGVPNSTSPSPIAVATSTQISLTKADSVEEVLSKMGGADFTNGISAASNNGGAGQSQISLRNLGPERVLILVDGQRLIPTFSGTATVVDLNSIPLSMVDQVQVLRDGASSVYGADAIGGVVNIITKKDFNGMEADVNYGQTGHGDGATYGISSTVGVNSDKGNVMVGISWDHRDAIAQSARSWAVDPHTSAIYGQGGSAYRGQINILQEENGEADGNSYVFANGNKYNIADPTVNWGAIDPALVYIPAAGQVKMNAGAPNWNDLTSGLDRKQISFSSHYNLTDNLRFIAEGFFTDRQANQQLRPEPLLGDAIQTFVPGTTNVLFPGFSIPTDQIPTQFSSTGTTGPFLAFLTPNQFGPRIYNEDSKTYRLRFGLEGTIFGKYDWEAGYVYQGNNTREDVTNEGNFEHLAEITEQIGCVDVPGGCKQGTLQNGQAGMVPVVAPNWFAGPNSIFTPAQVAYLTFDNIDQNQTSEEYGYANISGPIWDLPAGELKASVGAEIRREYLQDVPDELVQEGWAPNPSAISGGSYNVASVFGELNIPVLKDMPFAESLVLTPSARYDHYSNFGGAFTNKVGLDWKITKDIRVRGSFATGFRAPTTAELFGGHLVSDNGASGDPCDTRAAGYNGNSNVGVGLLTAGSTCAVALKNVAGALNGAGAVTNFLPSQDQITDDQIQVLEGGNPNLKPEQSESYGIGFVLTPRWTPGLSFSMDYYSVRISNTILTLGVAGTASPDIVLDGCYGAAQNEADCSLITRSASGTITQVNSLASNQGTEKVRGIDYELAYDTAAAHLNLPIPGSFRFDLQVNQLMRHSTENPDGTNNDFQGTFSADEETIQPTWRGNGSVDYRYGPWTAHYDFQYLSAMKDFNGAPTGLPASVYGDFIPNTAYHNIAISYSFSEFGYMKKARVTFGIDNLLDKDPPFIAGDSTCKCNSIGGPFDFAGRFFYGRLSASF